MSLLPSSHFFSLLKDSYLYVEVAAFLTPLTVRSQCNALDTALITFTALNHQTRPPAEMYLNPALRPMGANTSNRIAESMPKEGQVKEIQQDSAASFPISHPNNPLGAKAVKGIATSLFNNWKKLVEDNKQKQRSRQELRGPTVSRPPRPSIPAQCPCSPRHPNQGVGLNPRPTDTTLFEAE